VLLHVDRRPSVEALAQRLNVDEGVLFPYFEDHQLHLKLELGELEPDAFIEKVLGELPTEIHISEPELAEIYGRSFFVNDALIEIIDSYRPELRVILLSNTNHLDVTYIEQKFGLINWPDEAVLSYKIGMRKPNADIYSYVKDTFDLNLFQTLFIDDLPENIQAARQSGIPAQQYISPAQVNTLIRDLMNKR
jgi:putative hydrolase of the HAD superfamily